MKRSFYKFFIVFLMILPSTGLYAQNRGISLQVKTQGGEQLAQFGEAHALVIGESAYTNGWRQLPGVKEDVPAVKRLFEEAGFHVETIQDADSRSLSGGIKDFLDNYGYNKDARLIVYFAGHGATLTLGTNSKMGYIVPVDAPLPAADENTFKRRAIAMDQFNSWAKTYDARHILFMFDSCFSGTVFRSSGTPPPAISRLIGQPVRQFITAGAANEEVPDESVFRRQLEAAIRFGLADTDKDGYISGTELGLYLYNTVANYMNSRQNPQYGKLNDPNLDKGDFIFAVVTEQPIPAGLAFEFVGGKSVTITKYTGNAATVNIPEKIQGLPVTVIGELAFPECDNLTSVTIPSSVTTIGIDAFYGCDKLSSINIPFSVTHFGYGAVSGGDSLTAITVDSRNPSFTGIGGVLFDKNAKVILQYPRGKKGAYTIPSSVTTIGGWAFYDCDNLTSVTIPSSVTNIGNSAFYYCSGLTSVTLSRKTQVGGEAFPDSVKITYRD